MILGIETAVERVGVALGDGRGVLATAELASDRRHAESLTPMIDFVLGQAQLSATDLDAIAVDIGPGLFTGMRVGIAAAQAMAWALDIPVVPMCGLDVLASMALPLAAESERSIAVSLDARRGEVYWALYSSDQRGGEPVRLLEPQVARPDDMAIHLADRAEDVVCVGSGFVRYAGTFEAAPWAMLVGETYLSPSAAELVSMAVHRVARDQVVSCDAVEPMYLRMPDAEIHWVTREGAR